ncbi:MAG TPA: PQQ-dependent sugar dehydrogenase [Candidatus Udaeobacter sp.]|nr:PQQ-dependent sugar dehydrogenase [Candidatus Udaeobacter sp.]
MSCLRCAAITVLAFSAAITLATPARAINLPDGFVDDAIFSSFDLPTSMAFIPDGRLLVTEQLTGNVRMIVNGQIATKDPIFTVPGVSQGYERGLEGIAVDNGWPAKPYIYVFFTGTDAAIHIVRYTASGDLLNPNGGNLTLSTPLTLIDDVPDLDPVHNSGCLRVSSSGYLFASFGDDMDRCQAQDVTSLHGAIVRLRIDDLPAGGGGQVPRALLIPAGGNPYAANPDSNAKLVWAYGFRNPFRYQIDPATGKIYVADVGQDTAEEIDEIPVGGGGDYGWPFREANHIMSPTGCSEPGGPGNSSYIAPIVAFDHTSIDDTNGIVITVAGVYQAATGGANNWPLAYRGDLFYGEYFNGFIRRAHFNGVSWVPAAPDAGQPTSTEWATGIPSQVDFQIGPDGSMYWLAQGTQWDPTPQTGLLHRIRYAPNVIPPPPPPQQITGIHVTPNPFAATSDISFDMSSPSPVHLAIFDLNGRRVRRLLDGETPAIDSNGFAHATWDGLDDHGRRVRSGIYLIHLENRGRDVEARIVLVK